MPPKELTYTPEYIIGLIKEGHFVMPSINDLSWLGNRARRQDKGWDWANYLKE